MTVIPFEHQGLHVMVKPIGPICNLDCEYCYYLRKEELYPSGERWRMSLELLESFIEQYFAAQPAEIPEVTFAWQGGEPTLLGLDFFEAVVRVQKKHAPPGLQYANTLQTNGVLLTDEWCQFFKRENFLIGISIDGPAEVHDHYRYDKKGNPTFEKVMQGLHLLKSNEVEFNVLVVVNRVNARLGKKVYTYLRDNGAEHIQFIPIVEKENQEQTEVERIESEQKQECELHPWGKHVSERSVLPEQYGQFLVDVFDEWSRRDIGKVFVQIFDQALSAWMGYEPGLCIFRKKCGRALALEHNGDLYSCDHFVDPDWKLGNIQETLLPVLANSERQEQFGSDKEKTLPPFCRECEVRFVCNGGCPKNRFISTPSGEDGLNYLCAGYKQFFNHIDPVMKAMVGEIKADRSPANVMQMKRNSGKSQRASAKSTVGKPAVIQGMAPGQLPGRNDPCTCGSGRKFKKCCGA
ncbi:Anaerobic sulfatase-maturating enzyme [Polystyrenella longa]|uniref:Anaerobic sulfatase-maturating enzyme n=1 Tax=Polystyrenella longa TaxID=2528007 RepID=A0A518CQ80_9PLAN|nr:anaerobic sulfatase maturase [Polystyrenella longa]QDU81392.1 Anaerobic sulfatase-maturating enzyme [Polystyrenella longa]